MYDRNNSWTYQVTSHWQEMEEPPHPSFDQVIFSQTLVEVSHRFYSWHNTDRNWKNFDIHPLSLTDLYTLAEDSHGFGSWHHIETKWENINIHHSIDSHHLQKVVMSSSADLKPIGSGRKSPIILPSILTITALAEGGHGFVSWSHTDRKWTKVINHPSIDSHNHNTCRRWSWVHQLTLSVAAWSRLRYRHTHCWDRRLVKKRG